MKVNLKNPYGYKICYTKKGNKKNYIDDFHTYTYRRAVKVKQINHKYTKKKEKLTWYILPIT